MESSQVSLFDGSIDFRRLHFGDLSADCTNLMAMTAALIASLILRHSLQSVFDDEPKGDEQIQRVVERSAAYPEIVAQQFLAEFIQREMTPEAICRIKNSITLRRFTQVVGFQIRSQHLCDGCLYAIFHLQAYPIDKFLAKVQLLFDIRPQGA